MFMDHLMALFQLFLERVFPFDFVVYANAGIAAYILRSVQERFGFVAFEFPSQQARFWLGKGELG